jgi:negative regulator of sigma E activity
MNQRQDFTSAVWQRERSRIRMRRVTVAAGVASLAATGVVAYNLPGPAHTAAAKRTATTPATPATPAPQPSTAISHSGDDNEGSVTTVPGSAASQAPAQATSGGS